MVLWFWETVEAMAPAMRQRLLLFATGLRSLPLGGFAVLVGAFRCGLVAVRVWAFSVHLLLVDDDPCRRSRGTAVPSPLHAWSCQKGRGPRHCLRQALGTHTEGRRHVPSVSPQSFPGPGP